MLKRTDIIEKLAEKGYTKKDASIIMDDFVMVLMEALIAEESVMLRGFGTFTVIEYPEREMVDIATGNKHIVPAFKAPKFMPGKLLKRSIKEGFVRK